VSLVFGINLCDRLYLSGDVRLTKRTSNGDVEAVKDKVIKVVPFTSSITGAFAGDAGMASFVARKLKAVIRPNLDIRGFQNNICGILSPFIDDYWKTINSAAKLIIIFGGLNRNARKTFPNFAEIDAKIKNYALLHKNSPSMQLKPAIFNEFLRANNQPLRYPEPADSHIFSVEAVPPTTLRIENADWGEYLAHGPNGIRKESLDPIILGKLEFSGGIEVGVDNSMITAILKSVAEQKGAQTVGGPFFTVVIDEYTLGVVLGRIDRMSLLNMRSEFVSEITEIRGLYYSKDESGNSEKLISIVDYKSFGGLEI